MQKEKLMTKQESKKYETITRLLKGEITQKTASTILNLSTRQIRNLQKQVKKYDVDGIIHKAKGKPSNNPCVPLDIKEKIVDLAKTKYEGFMPTFLAEKLSRYENISYSKETIRKILLWGNVYQGKKLKEKHRSQRERRACRGELIQVDGSYHDWFSTGEKCWLLNFVDDATGEMFAVYSESESTIELMKAMKEYILQKGCPLALYVDKDSIYKTTRQQTIEEQLQGTYPITQFTRAMNELGIEVICANSPQAKGRVERSFKTHQDRLVKENKLLGITTIKEGNIHLKQYSKEHDKHFAVEPKCSEDLHQKRPNKRELDRILSIQEKRSIAKDFTIKYKNITYPILKEQKIIVLTRNSVIMEERLDGTLHIKYKDTYLKYVDITDTIRLKQLDINKQKEETKEVKTMNRKEISNVKSLHPWRKTNSLFFKKRKF